MVLERTEGISKAAAANTFQRIAGKELRDVDFGPGLRDLLPQNTDKLHGAVSVRMQAMQKIEKRTSCAIALIIGTMSRR